MSSTKEDFKKLNPYVKLILILAAIIGAFLLFRYIYVTVKKAREEKMLKDAVGTYSTGGATVVVNYGSVAQQIYNAFWNNDWFGWTEDEQAAIIALNNVPKPFIPQLKDTYYSIYGKNLNDDFVKYLSPEDYAKVQTLLT